MSIKPIVVVGSINADLVTRSKRLPVAGETIHGESFRVFHGGKGANQAVAVAKLNYPVHMVGMVGNDIFGADLRGALNGAGVNTSAVGFVEGASGIATIGTDEAGHNCIVVISGANGEVTPEYLDRHAALLAGAGMILMQLEIPMKTVAHLSTRAEEFGVPLMLDPAPAAHLPGEVLRRIDWFTPNFSEACFLLSKRVELNSPQSMISLAEELLTLGPRNVVLKLGQSGLAVATSDGNRFHLPAFDVTAVDTTAAGDALNGGFAAFLNAGKSVEEALRIASAVAAISVTRAGAQNSLPTAAELEAFLRKEEVAAR
jgi:ribokinase